MKQEFVAHLPAPKGEKEQRRLGVVSLGEGRYQVTIDGEARVVDARLLASQGRAMSLSILEEGGGRQLHVDIEGSFPEYKISSPAGETFVIKLEDACAGQSSVSQGGAVAPAGPVAVCAPMPGKVVKLLCALGEKVKQGQGLLIIEAMKMENELRAPCDGVVKEIMVTEGRSVEGSATLLRLEGAA